MRILLLGVAAGVLACSAARQPAPLDVTGDYRFAAVNNNPVPVEFPPGSGARLENGSLELQTNRRFSMRFGSRARGATEVTTSGEDGTYRIGGDTLFFTVDGREAQPPVTFRYMHTPSGLRLIDTRGNAWVYVRR